MEHGYTDGKCGIAIWARDYIDENDEETGKTEIVVSTTQNSACIKAGEPYRKPCGAVLEDFWFFFDGSKGGWSAQRLVNNCDAQAMFDALVQARQSGELVLIEGGCDV